MRKTYFVTGVAMLLALSAACSKQSATSVSPSSAKPASGNETSGPSGETLKVGAPVPISPINDAVLDGQDATLVCSAPTGTYTGTSLAYDFELYDSNNTKIRTEVVAGTTWVVRGLDFEGHYTWRVRGTSDNAYGPWSTFGSFTTPANRERNFLPSTVIGPRSSSTSRFGSRNHGNTQSVPRAAAMTSLCPSSSLRTCLSRRPPSFGPHSTRSGKRLAGAARRRRNA